MKLAKFDEIKSANQEQIARDLMRTRSTKEALKKVSTELNDTESKFEIVLASQRARWAKEEEEALLRISSLEREVQLLEKKRSDLLIPIDLIKENAHTMLKEAEKALLEAEEKQKNVDDITTLLHEKLDDVSEREESLNDREQRIKIQEDNLEIAKSSHAKLAEALRQDIENHLSDVTRHTSEYNTQKRELELQKINQDAMSEDIKVKMQKIDEEKKLIASQRAALQAALKEKINANTNSLSG